MRNFILSILALVAIAFIAAPEPAHAQSASAVYQQDQNAINKAVGNRSPLIAGLVPYATYSAAATAALSSPTETTIKAITTGYAVTPSVCEFSLPADNATNNLSVEVFEDNGTTENTLWVGHFDASAAAGSKIGFYSPKKTTVGYALKWQAWGTGGKVVWANCDYLLTK